MTIKDYRELIKDNFKKEEITGLMEKEKIGNRWCMTIKDCIDKESDKGQKGYRHVSIVYDDNEEGARRRCYEEFVYNYTNEMIKEGIINE